MELIKRIFFIALLSWMVSCSTVPGSPPASQCANHQTTKACEDAGCLAFDDADRHLRYASTDRSRDFDPALCEPESRQFVCLDITERGGNDGLFVHWREKEGEIEMFAVAVDLLELHDDDEWTSCDDDPIPACYCVDEWSEEFLPTCSEFGDSDACGSAMGCNALVADDFYVFRNSECGELARNEVCLHDGYSTGDGSFGYWREVQDDEFEVWRSGTIASLADNPSWRSCASEPIEVCSCVE